MNTAQDKIQVIQSSVRCFHCGLLSLVPILGSVHFVFALLYWNKAWMKTGTGWNPAKPFLDAGLILSFFGGLSNLAGVALFVHIMRLISG